MLSRTAWGGVVQSGSATCKDGKQLSSKKRKKNEGNPGSLRVCESTCTTGGHVPCALYGVARGVGAAQVTPSMWTMTQRRGPCSRLEGCRHGCRIEVSKRSKGVDRGHDLPVLVEVPRRDRRQTETRLPLRDSIPTMRQPREGDSVAEGREDGNRDLSARGQLRKEGGGALARTLQRFGALCHRCARGKCPLQVPCPSGVNRAAHFAQS